ncbi:MAG TPA: chemotaxis protein CheB [Gemmatimonadaceae bacterium]|nr:chemotaxis protein CheB [Gemmatimonadaceae bacterium]
MGYDIVAVGTSWGGLHALTTLVEGLPASWALPVIVVQHRSRDSHSLLAELLQAHTPLPVCEAEDKQPLEAGQVLIAPADYHLLVERGYVSLSTDPLVRYSRPSIDVMLESAADSYGPAAIGVIMTGANADGAAGLARLAARGGYAIVQDPAGAESPQMPRAALSAVPGAHVLPLAAIAPHLVSLVTPSRRGAGARP